MYEHREISTRLPIALALLAAASCGGGDAARYDAESTMTSGPSAGTSAAGATTAGGGDAGAGAGTTGSGGLGGEAGTGAPDVPDPTLDGPYEIATVDDVATVAATGHTVPIHCAYPTSGPRRGPYPVVVVAHGFQLPAAQYASYVARLATFGYVALTADYPATLFGVSNVDNAEDLSGAIDWAATAPAVAGIADTSNVGMSGHSMGGKLALLAATMDARVRAVITLDPVDGSMGCNPTDCPDVSDLMPLPIPTGFIGETLDSAAGFQPCAPASDNFQTFYANTTAPSLMVTVAGANHMSFLDDPSTCGFVCGFCQPATLDHDVVVGLSRSYLVAFFERHLRHDAAYDTYLTGAEAGKLWIETQIATIESK